MKRFFSPQEANQTLPLVKKIVFDILCLGQKIQKRALEVEHSPENDPAIQELVNQLEDLLCEIEALGCSYRDWNFSLGLVDFPALIEDREVLLCWRSDEEKVVYYHEVDGGYAGRKMLPEHLLEGL